MSQVQLLQYESRSGYALTAVFVSLIPMCLLHLLVLCLWIGCSAEVNDFLCRECGSPLSSLDTLRDETAEDSEGQFRDKSIPEKYNVRYDHFPEIVRFAGSI